MGMATRAAQRSDPRGLVTSLRERDRSVQADVGLGGLVSISLHTSRQTVTRPARMRSGEDVSPIAEQQPRETPDSTLAAASEQRECQSNRGIASAPIYKGFYPSSPYASRLMRLNHRDGGKAELILRRILWASDTDSESMSRRCRGSLI